MLVARELEMKYLSNQVRTVSSGAIFEKGGDVGLINKDGEPLAMPRYGRFTSERVSNFVIYSFLVEFNISKNSG